MATSLSTPKLTLSSPTIQNLRRNIPASIAHCFPSIGFRTGGDAGVGVCRMKKSEFRLQQDERIRLTAGGISYRRFCVKAESENGVEGKKYDFDLFTIGAGSGGVRASRFAANYGASVAVCELPFSTIASETAGGVGGTYVEC